MNSRIYEALNLLQEECAEVIVEISKVKRFGLMSAHHSSGLTHQSMLEIEIADVLTLIDILIEEGIISTSSLELAKQNKKDKLKKWSTLYENQSK